MEVLVVYEGEGRESERERESEGFILVPESMLLRINLDNIMNKKTASVILIRGKKLKRKGMKCKGKLRR